MIDEELLDYYSRRAAEYEQIYSKPERQTDLARVREWLRSTLAGHRILEVACGTGYWTALLAPVAEAIVATDASEEVLAIARAKSYPPGRVRFERADAYALTLASPRAGFTAAFAGFWWSHVPLERTSAFLASLHAQLAPDGKVLLLDNRFVEGSSTAIARRDAEGNTYQRRRLADGSEHEILKNFPTRSELEAALRAVSRDLDVIEFDYYWIASYTLAAT